MKLHKVALDMLDKVFENKRKVKVIIFATSDWDVEDPQHVVRHYITPVNKSTIKNDVIEILEENENLILKIIGYDTMQEISGDDLMEDGN